MKTYNSPKTEYTAFIRSGILCESHEGEGIGSSTPPDTGSGGSGNLAPRRRVFF